MGLNLWREFFSYPQKRQEDTKVIARLELGLGLTLGACIVNLSRNLGLGQHDICISGSEIIT